MTLEPCARKHAVLDGQGLLAPRGLTAMVEIDDSSGVTVHGHDNGVSIVANHVHDSGNDNPTLGSFDINAHGIAVYGDDPRAPVSNLVISGNTVDRLKLGASETVVGNGNVEYWAIVGNHIHDVNNIASTRSGSNRR